MTSCPQNVWNHTNGCVCTPIATNATDGTPSPFGTYTERPESHAGRRSHVEGLIEARDRDGLMAIASAGNPGDLSALAHHRNALCADVLDAAVRRGWNFDRYSEGRDAAERLVGGRHASSETQLWLAEQGSEGLDVVAQCTVLDGMSSPSPEVLDVVAGHRSAEVRTAVASHRATSSETLDRLARDRATKVRNAVAGNSTTSGKTLSGLLADKDDAVRRTALLNDNVLPDDLRGFVDDPSNSIQEIVFDHPNLPLDLIDDAVHSGDARKTRAVSQNLALRPAHQEALASGDRETRRRLADHDDLTPSVAMRLADDPDSTVRATIARQTRNQGLADVARHMAASPDGPTRSWVASYTTDRQVLEVLARDESDYVRTDVVGNPSVPIEVLESMRNDPDLGLRRTVIKHLSYRK